MSSKLVLTYFIYINTDTIHSNVNISQPASVAHLDARPTGDQEVAGRPPLGWHYSFVEIDHEIFSVVILSLPLIQEV